MALSAQWKCKKSSLKSQLFPSLSGDCRIQHLEHFAEGGPKYTSKSPNHPKATDPALAPLVLKLQKNMESSVQKKQVFRKDEKLWRTFILNQMGQYGHQKMQNVLLYMPLNYGLNWWAYIGVIRVKDVLTFLPAKTLPGKKVKQSVQNYTSI